MKFSVHDAKVFIARPDTACAGFLVYGPDPMLVAHARERIVNFLKASGDGIRHQWAVAESLRGGAELLSLSLKSQDFFDERKVISVDKAGDGMAPAARMALDAHCEGDGWFVFTAGSLKPSSKLRQLFESNDRAAALPVYDAAMSAAEIQAALRNAGVTDVEAAALSYLTSLGRELPPQSFAQMIEKLSLYKEGDGSPLRLEEAEACAPPSGDGSLNGLIDLVMDGKTAKVGPVLRQVYGNGHKPVEILIRARWSFRSLLSVAGHADGPAKGVSAMRPPLFGPRRDRMLARARRWGASGAETALVQLLAADRELRSSVKIPEAASVERVLMRLSMLRAD